MGYHHCNPSQTAADVSPIAKLTPAGGSVMRSESVGFVLGGGHPVKEWLHHFGHEGELVLGKPVDLVHML